MKRSFFVVFVLGVLSLATIALLSSYARFPLILPTGKVLGRRFYDYAGVTHVHTSLSTGSGNLGTLAKAGSLTNCAFIIMTDLNPPPESQSLEGYHNDVLMIWAGEYTYLGGHLLAYNVPESRHFKGPGDAQIFFNDLLEKKPSGGRKGFLVAAHPFLPQHSWENLALPGLTGMEVINLDSFWHNLLNQNKFGLFWSLLTLPFNPDLSFVRLYNEPTRELEKWDELLKTRNFMAYGGHDSTANAIPFPGRSLAFPSYGRTFRLLKNHVLLTSELTGSFESDKNKILNALAAGHFYISVDLIGDPSGFYFVAEQRQKEYLSGSTLSLKNGPVSFTVDLGHDIGVEHELILLRDGRGVMVNGLSSLKWIAKEPGTYRSLVRVSPYLPFPDGKKTMTWIISNAIRVE